MQIVRRASLVLSVFRKFILKIKKADAINPVLQSGYCMLPADWTKWFLLKGE